MPRKLKFALLIVALAVCRSAGAQDHQPSYKVDAEWPRQLPNNWVMGQVSGIAVDRQDHVWVLQRPGSNAKDELAAAQSPPVSQSGFAAPPAVEFDRPGNSMSSWRRTGAG